MPTAPSPATALFALAVAVGAVIARRHPAAVGGVLVFAGVILIPISTWAINFANGWADEPTPWRFREYLRLGTIAGVPLLAGCPLLLCAGAHDSGRTDRYRHSTIGDTKSMWSP